MPAPVHVTIPEPCHENWQQMTPNEQGRHCMACQKTVVDFTLMSDQEILDHISRATSSVCGRFNNDQLNKTYVEKRLKPSFTFRYVWNMITAAFLLTGGAACEQVKKTGRKKPAINSNGEVLGKVAPPVEETTQFDATYALMGSIAIKLPDTAEPSITKVEATKCGAANPDLQETTGEAADTLVVPSIEIPTPDAAMDTIAPPVDEVMPIVTEDSVVAIAGGIMVSHEVTITERVTREVIEWLPFKKALRIYPNPVMPGHTVNINLEIDKAGTYKLEIMDASGRVVYVQALQVVRQAQVVNVPTQSSWSRGVYWVRISNATDKKVYQAKILLQ